MPTFEPVWLSTEDHLKKFHALYKQASLLDRMFGLYTFPQNFPYLHMYWGLLPFFRIPAVCIASGASQIDDARFCFQPKPFNVFGSVTKNLRTDLEFELGANELIHVARARADSPVIQYYSIPFIRVQSTRQGFLNDFLVCVGGAGPFMGKVIARSDELFNSLTNMAPKQ